MKGAYKIIDSSGNVVFSSLSIEEEELFAGGASGIVVVRGNKARLGKISNERGSIYLSSTDPDLVKSTKLFRSHLEVLSSGQEYLLDAISAVEGRLVSNSKRLVHNLTSLNGHMIQDIYSVVSQDRLAGNIRRSIPLIQSEMTGKKSYDFAKCFLNLAKHSAAMKNEFSVFKKIDSLESGIEKRAHSMHKVVMNVAYLFFSDFADKGGYIDVAHSEVRGAVDYECAFVALYHLFDNAAKYTCPDTNVEVSISIDENVVAVCFSMCSLAILHAELPRLTTEGFSGSIPRRLQLNGDGVGLSLVQRVMKLHGGSLEILSDADSLFVRDDVEYQSNSFILKFPVE